MVYILIAGMVVLFAAIAAGFRLGWELLRQNGRMLLRMEALEKRINQIESTSGNQPAPYSAVPAYEPPDGEGASADTTEARTSRFANRSLASSKLQRDGLKPNPCSWNMDKFAKYSCKRLEWSLHLHSIRQLFGEHFQLHCS